MVFYSNMQLITICLCLILSIEQGLFNLLINSQSEFDINSNILISEQIDAKDVSLAIINI